MQGGGPVKGIGPADACSACVSASNWWPCLAESRHGAAGAQAVRWLWEVVGEFEEEERRRFLKFFTGSDRAPIGGLGNLRCACALMRLTTHVKVHMLQPAVCMALPGMPTAWMTSTLWSRSSLFKDACMQPCCGPRGPGLCRGQPEASSDLRCGWRMRRCVIQRDGTDSLKLPTSHTCFNTLLLPSYRSKAALAEKMRLAIMNSEGFGLE